MAQLSATAAAEAHWAALSSPWAAGTEVWTQAQLLERAGQGPVLPVGAADLHAR